jgi:hypothetical protein
MTKAEQIRLLLHQGKSSREVAMEVFSLDENAPPKLVETKIAYVRAARQRSPEYVPPDIKSKASEIIELIGTGKTAREIAMILCALDESAPTELIQSKTQHVQSVIRERTGTNVRPNGTRVRQLLKVVRLQRKAKSLGHR